MAQQSLWHGNHCAGTSDAMMQHMQDLCATNNPNTQDVCVLIHLSEILPEPSERDLFDLVFETFAYDTYKLEHIEDVDSHRIKYGFICRGHPTEVIQARKGLVSFLRNALDKHLGVQYAASFGIAPRVKGDLRATWYKRAVKALDKALHKATNARTKSNSKRKDYIVIEYADTARDDDDDDDYDDDEEKKVLEDEARPIFPDSHAMTNLMALICNENYVENKGYLVLLDFVHVKQSANARDRNSTSRFSKTAPSARRHSQIKNVRGFKSIENILAPYKEKGVCYVFHVDSAYSKMKRNRQYALIIDDPEDLEEIATKIEWDCLAKSYRMSFGIAKRADDDSSVEWFERACEALEEHQALYEREQKQEEEQKKIEMMIKRKALHHMKFVLMKPEPTRIDDPTYAPWYAELRKVQKGIYAEYFQKCFNKSISKTPLLPQSFLVQQQPPLDRKVKAEVDVFDDKLSGYVSAKTSKGSKLIIKHPNPDSEDSDDGLEYEQIQQTCDICQMPCRVESDIPKRDAQYRRERGHKCHLCASTFKNRRSLKRHLQSKHGKEIVSDIVCQTCRRRGRR